MLTFVVLMPGFYLQVDLQNNYVTPSGGSILDNFHSMQQNVTLNAMWRCIKHCLAQATTAHDIRVYTHTHSALAQEHRLPHCSGHCQLYALHHHCTAKHTNDAASMPQGVPYSQTSTKPARPWSCSAPHPSVCASACSHPMHSYATSAGWHSNDGVQCSAMKHVLTCSALTVQWHCNACIAFESSLSAACQAQAHDIAIAVLSGGRLGHHLEQHRMPT